MRILIAYPGPTHSTYDVAAGYEKALRQLGHEVYGYPYHKWLGFYGEALTHWDKINEQYKLAQGDVILHSSEKLVIAAVEFRPDVIIIVSGSALHKHVYDLLHSMDIPLVLMLTESPYEDSKQKLIVEQGHIVHTFTNERLSVDVLGDAVTYLPHSFDPDIHKPMDVNGDFQSDVFFHGTLWPERAQLLDVIMDSLPAIDLQFSGIVVSENVDSGKLVDNENLAKLYNGAKICLNHHRRFGSKPGEYIPKQSAESIGPRTYEIAACGAFQLCDDTRPELWEVFGDSVPTYTNASDLATHIEYFMQRPRIRKGLADLARLRVQKCTFANRVQEIVEPILRGL